MGGGGGGLAILWKVAIFGNFRSLLPLIKRGTVWWPVLHQERMGGATRSLGPLPRVMQGELGRERSKAGKFENGGSN